MHTEEVQRKYNQDLTIIMALILKLLLYNLNDITVSLLNFNCKIIRYSTLQVFFFMLSVFPDRVFNKVQRHLRREKQTLLRCKLLSQ